MQLAIGLVGALIGAAAALAGQWVADSYARRRDRYAYAREAAADYIAQVRTLLSIFANAYVNKDGKMDTARLDAIAAPLAHAAVTMLFALEDLDLPRSLLDEAEAAWADVSGSWDKRTLDQNNAARANAHQALKRVRLAVAAATASDRPAAERLTAYARRNLEAEDF